MSIKSKRNLIMSLTVAITATAIGAYLGARKAGKEREV